MSADVIDHPSRTTARKARDWIAAWERCGGRFAIVDDEVAMHTADIPKPIAEEVVDLVLWTVAWPGHWKTVQRIIVAEDKAI